LKDLAQEDAGPAIIVEVGAGAGNTAFPVMKHNRNPNLRLHACDFSKKAIQVIKSSPEFAESQKIGTLEASVWDIASPPCTEETTGEVTYQLPEGMSKGSVDVVILVFTFSALLPNQWEQAIRNVWEILRPGGIVLFRDYGRGDLAQVRFKSGRYLEENFYARGDGTRVYFFEEEELKRLWSGEESKNDAEVEIGDRPRFEIVNFGVDRRMLVNRQRKLKMYRCWMQARLRKPTESRIE
jgi:tRNAThr (cytosine32-N3)-methyltransferase